MKDGSRQSDNFGEISAIGFELIGSLSGAKEGQGVGGLAGWEDTLTPCLLCSSTCAAIRATACPTAAAQRGLALNVKLPKKNQKRLNFKIARQVAARVPETVRNGGLTGVDGAPGRGVRATAPAPGGAVPARQQQMKAAWQPANPLGREPGPSPPHPTCPFLSNFLGVRATRTRVLFSQHPPGEGTFVEKQPRRSGT